MQTIWPYLTDLYAALPPALAYPVLMLVSTTCGIIVGMERESRDKPAGLRTIMLICIGSTVFTLASILMAGGHEFADRGRVAANIVTGIGFLGAGAIIRDQGAVRGLTTAATIWTVAAIGLLVGTGYAAAGLVLAVFIVTASNLLRRFERPQPTGQTHG